MIHLKQARACSYRAISRSRYDLMETRLYSLGNPSKDRQRFVDAFVLILAFDWSVRLSKIENVVEMQIEPAFER